MGTVFFNFIDKFEAIKKGMNKARGWGKCIRWTSASHAEAHIVSINGAPENPILRTCCVLAAYLLRTLCTKKKIQEYPILRTCCVLVAYLVRSCCVLGIFYFRSTNKRKKKSNQLIWRGKSGCKKVKLLMQAPPIDPRTMPAIRMKALKNKGW